MGCAVGLMLCRYDRRNGDLFILSCERRRLWCLLSVSSEWCMLGAGVSSILLSGIVDM